MSAASQVRLRADGRPLYAQARQALRRLIEDGAYALGDRLPSEPALAQQLGISRPTLREALRMLEDEGAIVRRHGVGTFVAAPRPRIDAGLELLESIDRMAERAGLHAQMGALVYREFPAPAQIAARLGLAEGAAVTDVTRVMLADGRRIAFLTDVLPQEYLRGDELAAGFQGSVLDRLLARGWPALSHSRTELSACAAEAAVARELHVKAGEPLLKLEAQLFAADGRVVDYSTSYFVPGFFRFHVVRRIG
ncbi:MAG: HTH-type transcriptional repressor YvoA [Chloroflexi bacterium ADurb.Bin325]|nr:MAG: HTH-type transcriptional repressor YvoA [Chloroflexi bacterium ADurb.Bin325]